MEQDVYRDIKVYFVTDVFSPWGLLWPVAKCMFVYLHVLVASLALHTHMVHMTFVLPISKYAEPVAWGLMETLIAVGACGGDSINQIAAISAHQVGGSR